MEPFSLVGPARLSGIKTCHRLLTVITACVFLTLSKALLHSFKVLVGAIMSILIVLFRPSPYLNVLSFHFLKHKLYSQSSRCVGNISLWTRVLISPV